MNLLPKRNLWVMKSVQVVRMFSATGPNWSTGSDSVTSSNRPPVDSGKKQGSKENVIKTMGYVTPQGLACDAQAQTRHGAGSGGRGSGSIQDAGGTFKKIGAAKEAQFFYKKERELIENLKSEMKDQIRFHEKQIEMHQAAIEKIKSKQKDV